MEYLNIQVQARAAFPASVAIIKNVNESLKTNLKEIWSDNYLYCKGDSADIK